MSATVTVLKPGVPDPAGVEFIDLTIDERDDYDEGEPDCT